MHKEEVKHKSDAEQPITFSAFSFYFLICFVLLSQKVNYEQILNIMSYNKRIQAYTANRRS